MKVCPLTRISSLTPEISPVSSLGLLFFINWFTDFFIESLGTEDEIKIKIKYNTST